MSLVHDLIHWKLNTSEQKQASNHNQVHSILLTIQNSIMIAQPAWLRFTFMLYRSSDGFQKKIEYVELSLSENSAAQIYLELAPS